MTDEVRKKLQEFRDKEGDLIINILENVADKVENTYGKDTAVGFILGLDTVFFALTGKEMREVIKEREKKWIKYI